jgi:uncharacterized membrane protein YraQ (UPF0718 family)
VIGDRWTPRSRVVKFMLALPVLISIVAIYLYATFGSSLPFRTVWATILLLTIAYTVLGGFVAWRLTMNAHARQHDELGHG